jgi:hypothetical protein
MGEYSAGGGTIIQGIDIFGKSASEMIVPETELFPNVFGKAVVPQLGEGTLQHSSSPDPHAGNRQLGRALKLTEILNNSHPDHSCFQRFTADHSGNWDSQCRQNMVP